MKIIQNKNSLTLTIKIFRFMKKVKLILVAIVIMIASFGAMAQVSINTDGSSADPSAMLDVKSSDKGFMPPRVANVSAVSSPVAGLLVYDISNQCMRYYNGSTWSLCMGREFQRKFQDFHP